MKNKENSEDKVYVIGKDTHRRKNWTYWLVGGLLAIIVITVAVVVVKTQHAEEPARQLAPIEVLPENGSQPLFMQKYTFDKFFAWIGQNIRYPKGKESESGKVTVSFVITKEGKVADIKILSQPSEKAFGREVVRLLQSCPQWTPGKLADGSPVDMRYSLPIDFRSQE